MTKLEQIQKENRKFILEAIHGCSYEEALKKEYAKKGNNTISVPLREYEGEELTLSRVLLASIKSAKCMDCFEHQNNKHCSSGWHLNTKDNSSRIRDFILDNWKNLELETLEEQAEETQTKINELFNN